MAFQLPDPEGKLESEILHINGRRLGGVFLGIFAIGPEHKSGSQ